MSAGATKDGSVSSDRIGCSVLPACRISSPLRIRRVIGAIGNPTRPIGPIFLRGSYC